MFSPLDLSSPLRSLREVDVALLNDLWMTRGGVCDAKRLVTNCSLGTFVIGTFRTPQMTLGVAPRNARIVVLLNIVSLCLCSLRLSSIDTVVASVRSCCCSSESKKLARHEDGNDIKK